DWAMIAKALKNYESVATTLGDFPDARDIVALGQLRIASLRALLGEWSQAENGFRHAVHLYEELANQFPQITAYRRGQSKGFTGLAQALQNIGNPAESQARFRDAIAIASKLAAESPADPALVTDLAQA